MDQYESAANIEFTINISENSSIGQDEIVVPVTAFDGNKDVGIEQIRGNALKAIGFSVTEIEFSGSVSFDGNGFITVDGSTYHLEDLFTNDNGVPVSGSEVIIYHEDTTVIDGGAKQTVYKDVMITSDGYESNEGEVSGLTFDFIAGDRVIEEVN